MSAFETGMARNRGIPRKIVKSLIKLYFSCFLFIVFLFILKSLSVVIYFLCEGNICWPLRQIRREIGKSLTKFSNH